MTTTPDRCPRCDGRVDLMSEIEGIELACIACGWRDYGAPAVTMRERKTRSERLYTKNKTRKWKGAA